MASLKRYRGLLCRWLYITAWACGAAADSGAELALFADPDQLSPALDATLHVAVEVAHEGVVEHATSGGTREAASLDGARGLLLLVHGGVVECLGACREQCDCIEEACSSLEPEWDCRVAGSSCRLECDRPCASSSRECAPGWIELLPPSVRVDTPRGPAPDPAPIDAPSNEPRETRGSGSSARRRAHQSAR